MRVEYIAGAFVSEARRHVAGRRREEEEEEGSDLTVRQERRGGRTDTSHIALPKKDLLPIQ